MIEFKNLIVGRHESKFLFTWKLENGVSMLGAFVAMEDGIETILARYAITPTQRAVLESSAQSQERKIGTSRFSEKSPFGSSASIGRSSK
jgi:hypothetical protein